jgi:hypothetical protein
VATKYQGGKKRDFSLASVFGARAQQHFYLPDKAGAAEAGNIKGGALFFSLSVARTHRVLVRTRGLEPPTLAGPDPKSGASAIPPRAQPAAGCPILPSGAITRIESRWSERARELRQFGRNRLARTLAPPSLSRGRLLSLEMSARWRRLGA